MKSNLIYVQIYLFMLLSISGYPQSEKLSMKRDQIPNIDFCELIANPEVYIDKTFRITAEFTLATEGVYLTSQKC